MLLEQLRTELTKSMKEKNGIKTGVIRMVIGEAGQTNAVADSELHSIIRKMVERNNETIKFLKDHPERIEELETEIKILQGYLPRTLSRAEIRSSLLAIIDQLRASKEGAAVGLAMKHMKSDGTHVDGKDVKEVVFELRQSPC